MDDKTLPIFYLDEKNRQWAFRYSERTLGGLQTGGVKFLDVLPEVNRTLYLLLQMCEETFQKDKKNAS